MNTIEENIREFQDRINQLENQLKNERNDIESYKQSQKDLYDNYAKTPLNIDDVDEEIMTLDDKIRDSDAKIKGLEARILNRKRSLLLFRYNTQNI
jgi:chromosome segregation ATPase